MTPFKGLVALAVGLCLALAADIEVRIERAAGGGISLDLRPSEASAQTYRAQNRRVARRTARRTSRRVERRQDYYDSLPGGCILRGGYHYCGGIYYQPVVQSGRTVYIVVNP